MKTMKNGGTAEMGKAEIKNINIGDVVNINELYGYEVWVGTRWGSDNIASPGDDDDYMVRIVDIVEDPDHDWVNCNILNNACIKAEDIYDDNIPPHILVERI